MVFPSAKWSTPEEAWPAWCQAEAPGFVIPVFTATVMSGAWAWVLAEVTCRQAGSLALAPARGAGDGAQACSGLQHVMTVSQRLVLLDSVLGVGHLINVPSDSLACLEARPSLKHKKLNALFFFSRRIHPKALFSLSGACGHIERKPSASS